MFAEKFEVFSKENLGSVRTLTKEDGSIWFVGADVCRILEHTNPSKAYKVLAEDEQVIIDPNQKLVSKTGKGGAQKLKLVSESGMYMLILKSRMPKAEPFQRWITREVLPSIRKNGGYIFGQETLPDAERESLEKDIQALSARVKADTADLAMFSKYITELSDMYRELKAKYEPEAKPIVPTSTFVGPDGLIYYSREELINANEARN